MQISGKNYSVTIISALVILAVVIGVFVYSLISGEPDDISDIIFQETENGTPALTPAGNSGPTSPPNITPPTSPPPGN